MYFIVKGVVKITSVEGVEFATLKAGDNFGEMAILDTKKPIRGANVVSVTQCSLALLTV